MIVKMYRAFDKVFASDVAAEKEVEGWEHKEWITPVWVAVHTLEDLPDVILYDEMYEHVLEFGTDAGTVASSYEAILEMEGTK